MGAKTSIPWTGATWNVGRGCRKKDPGCLNCYAMYQAIRGAGPGGRYEGLVRMTTNGPQWTGEVAFDDKALLLPARWREPRFVFVDSMSDLFYERFSDEQIAATIGAMMLAPLHVFQVLTKREDRAAALCAELTPWLCMLRARERGAVLSPVQAARTYAALPERHPLRPLFRPGGAASAPDLTAAHGDELSKVLWPLPNLWLGASCNDQASYNQRVRAVRSFGVAAVRFLSLEPLTGPIDLGDELRERRSYTGGPLREPHIHTPIGTALCERMTCTIYRGSRLDQSIEWLIVGGESTTRARPCEVEWIRDILRQARYAGPTGEAVAVFVKQLGARAVDSGLLGAYMRAARQTPPLVQIRFLKDRKGENPREWPEDLLVQDYPQGVYVPAVQVAA